MKKLSILAVMLLAACQPSSSDSNTKTGALDITAINAPASDDVETLDMSLLPEGFPIIGEMQSAARPAGCALSKANRQAGEQADYDARYVFAKRADGDYQLGINGELRTVRQSGAADTDATIIRYFKTIDGEEVEVLVSYSQTDEGLTGIVGRIKAWDADLPLMCGYNRIQITGECDL